MPLVAVQESPVSYFQPRLVIAHFPTHLLYSLPLASLFYEVLISPIPGLSSIIED